ncbi:MAG: PAS domain S-box protein [Pyrinomonadaceae bacterium]
MGKVSNLSESTVKAKSINHFEPRFLDALENAIIITDLDGVIAYWNRAATELYQWTADEAIGRGIVELFMFAPTAEKAYEIMNLLRRGQSWKGDFTVSRKDGTSLPISVTNSPLYDDKDVLIGIVGLSEDVSDRRRAEEELRESESRYRFLVENASDGIHTYDIEGSFIETNARFREMLGYSREELQNLRVQDLVPPDDLINNPIQFQALLSGQTLLKERRLRRKNGTTFIAEISGKMMQNGVLEGSIRDVSERRRTQVLLNAQKEALEMVVTDAPLTAILTHLTNTVEELSEHSVTSSILLLDSENRLRNGASPSLPDTYIQKIDGIVADENVGTCSAAAATRMVVITPDIAADPKWNGLANLPIELGLRAAWSVPILSKGGRVLGTFGTYFRELREPDFFERQVVEILARTAALAIERKQFDEQLKQTDERLQKIFEASQEGILVEENGNIVYVNESYLRQFGYENSAGLIGRNVSIVISPKDADRLAEFGRRRVQGLKAPAQYEFVGKRKDGTLIDLEASVSTSVAGGHTYSTTMIRDITKRKLAAIALRRSESQLRLVANAIPLLVSFIDSEKRYRFVNRGYAEWFNIPFDKLVGMHLSEVIGQAAFETLLPEIERVLSGEEVSVERSVPYRTGERFIRLNYVPQKEGENVTGFHSFVWDISARKAGERELRRARSRLEERVVERTRELEAANKERIEILQKLVVAQENERRRMARDVHDQLGQQMTVLRLKLEELKKHRAENPEWTRQLDELSVITRQVDSDVDFLAWKFRPAVLDDIGIAAALDEYVKQWSKHFDIPAKFDARRLGAARLPPEVETNYYRIVQEALNNIAKHAEASNVVVMLEPRDDGTILIIEDDGAGFAPDKLIAPGDGMGLIGIRERVALMGGALEIESNPGRGTTIFVNVPRRNSTDGVESRY